jgi:hypothetical protein
VRCDRRSPRGYRKNRAHYSQVLNPRCRGLIEKICAQEIARFSYRWTEAE